VHVPGWGHGCVVVDEGVDVADLRVGVHHAAAVAGEEDLPVLAAGTV
jgi:hypothetical protein